MVYIIWGMLGFLSLIVKNNKYLTALIWFFIVVVFSFNTKAADLISYIAQYDGYELHFTEPIFVVSGNLFRRAGFSFFVYRAFIAILCISLISWTLYKLTPYPTLALFMYTIYPMTIDVVQIRFTAAYSIVFFGIYFLIKYQHTRRKNDAIIFFIMVIIATGLHYSALLYGAIGLLFGNINKHRFVYLVLIPAVIIMCIIFIERFTPIIANIIGERKANTWISEGREVSLRRLFFVFGSRVLPLFFATFLASVSKTNDFMNNIGEGKRGARLFFSGSIEVSENLNYDFTINRCLFMCMFYIFLYTIFEIIIKGDYERLQRLSLLISTVLITRQLFYIEKRNRVIALMLYVIVYFVYFSAIMFVKSDNTGVKYFDYVFRLVMESNAIFGELNWLK